MALTIAEVIDHRLEDIGQLLQASLVTNGFLIGANSIAKKMLTNVTIWTMPNSP
jgi:hypothetical protein